MSYMQFLCFFERRNYVLNLDYNINYALYAISLRVARDRAGMEQTERAEQSAARRTRSK